MSINFQEILKELEYRVEHGIIDLTKEEQVTKLTQILKENGVSDANEMAQKARVYYSYLNEANQSLDKVLKQKFTNPETGNQVTVASALGYEKNKKAYGIAKGMMTTAGYSTKDIDMVDAGPDDEEKPKSNRGRKKKVVEEIKVEEEPIEEFVLTEITTGTTTIPIDNPNDAIITPTRNMCQYTAIKTGSINIALKHPKTNNIAL